MSANSEIYEIFDCFKACAVKIADVLRNPSLKYLDSVNFSGDTQLQVDVMADKLIEEELLKLPCIKGVCSEEKESVVFSEFSESKGANSQIDSENGAKFMVAYDPLDGSSLVDANLSIGTIFGIYETQLQAQNLVASGYVLYGPRLEIVCANKKTHAVEHFRFCKNWEKLGDLRLNQKGKIQATGGTQAHWEKSHKAFIDSLFAQGYRLRYSGGMVPDLHQILIKGGGLFSYPATSDAPAGKLRKLFEVFPFALIFEIAGGNAVMGACGARVLDLDTQNIHETTPCFFGSKDEINALKNFKI